MFNNPYMPYNQQYGAPAPVYNSPVIPQQAAVNAQQQPVQNKKTNCEWIPVNGIQQVREHIVQPDQMLYFLDNNERLFYRKMADSFGTARIQTFRFDEVEEPGITSSTPDIKEELKNIYQRLDRLERRNIYESSANANEQSNNTNDSASLAGRNESAEVLRKSDK